MRCWLSDAFYTYTAAEGKSKRLLASCSFVSPIVTFVRLKKDTDMEERKYSTAFANMELINIVPTCNDDSKSRRSSSDTVGDEVPCSRSSRRRSNRRYRKGKKQKDVGRFSSLFEA